MMDDILNVVSFAALVLAGVFFLAWLFSVSIFLGVAATLFAVAYITANLID